jgi:tetratricopeptide (TPR) repeat protein/DNA-binding CsgD family transcriptional regulator
MKITSYSLLLISLFLGYFSYSQSNSVDILLKEADSLLKIDTNKAINLAKSVIKIEYINSKQYIHSTIILRKGYKALHKGDSAVYYIEKGLNKAIKIKDTLATIDLYINRARIFFKTREINKSLSDYAKAKHYFESLSKEKQNKNIIQYARIHNNIGSIYIRINQLDSSIVYLTKSINIMEENNLSKSRIAFSKHNLGEVFHQLKDDKKNIDMQKQSIEDCDKKRDLSLISSCYISLATSFQRLNDTLKAINNYEKGLEISKSLKEYYNQAVANQNIATLYLKKHEHHKSYQYFLKAKSLYNKIKLPNAGVYIGLGMTHHYKKNYDSAVYYHKKAIKIARKHQALDYESNAYSQLSKVYNTQKKYAQAYKYLDKHLLLEDSLLNKDKQEIIQTLKTKFETEQKEKEIAHLKELNESEHQKAQVIQSRQQFIIIAIILALALLLVILLAYRNKKKKEKRLMAVKLENQKLMNKEYELDIEHKTKQLTTHALNMLQKNKMLTEIKDKIKEMSKGSDSYSPAELKSITRTITQTQKTDKDWDLFKRYFENVKKDFNKNLAAINPDLTTNDYRLAALVSLNLNIKETAALLNISPNSVKIARHRLRKRLYIKTGEDLYTFIANI